MSAADFASFFADSIDPLLAEVDGANAQEPSAPAMPPSALTNEDLLWSWATAGFGASALDESVVALAPAPLPRAAIAAQKLQLAHLLIQQQRQAAMAAMTTHPATNILADPSHTVQNHRPKAVAKAAAPDQHINAAASASSEDAGFSFTAGPAAAAATSARSPSASIASMLSATTNNKRSRSVAFDQSADFASPEGSGSLSLDGQFDEDGSGGACAGDDDETVAEKRRRNSAASARFRMKKKMREAELAKTAKEMSDRAEVLQKRVNTLETEVKYLRELLTLKINVADVALPVVAAAVGVKRDEDAPSLATA